MRFITRAGFFVLAGDVDGRRWRMERGAWGEAALWNPMVVPITMVRHGLEGKRPSRLPDRQPSFWRAVVVRHCHSIIVGTMVFSKIRTWGGEVSMTKPAIWLNLGDFPSASRKQRCPLRDLWRTSSRRRIENSPHSRALTWKFSQGEVDWHSSDGTWSGKSTPAAASSLASIPPMSGDGARRR